MKKSIPVNKKSRGRPKRPGAEGSRNVLISAIPSAPSVSTVTPCSSAFLTSLAADPYNVEATYSLAAAYAVIGRKQCSINLLTRLLQMRPHPSKHAEVEASIDRLLGRRQPLDPDFSSMRRDNRFRTLIEKMCEGTNDPNCGNFSHHQAKCWMRQLHLTKEDTEFWWMHDSVDQIHGDGSLKLLEKYLKTEEEKRMALRAAEESMMAWQIYFDGFYYEGLKRSAGR